jgi:Na+/H+-dicarboxylate symporter
VDRLLDMCRTVVNVTGDLVACVIIDRHFRDPAAEIREHLGKVPTPAMVLSQPPASPEDRT